MLQINTSALRVGYELIPPHIAHRSPEADLQYRWHDREHDTPLYRLLSIPDLQFAL